MTLSPFGSLALGGVSSLAIPADPSAGAMGAMLLGLLALTALVLIVARRQSA
jgi:hypothetical protein